MTEKLLRIHRSLTTMARWVALVGAGALVLSSAGVMVNVLSRWLLNAPIKGVEDLSSFAFAVAICSFFPMGLIRGNNVAVRFLGSALGLRAARWLEATAATITTGMIAVFASALLEHASYATAQGLTSLTLEWPQAPWWWAGAAIFALSLPVQVWVLFLAVLGAVTGRDPIPEGEGGPARPAAALTE